MMGSKLFYTIFFIIGSFTLEEVYAAKKRPVQSDPSYVLECSNRNDTKTNSLVCCAKFPIRQCVCTALSANITTGNISASTLVNPPRSLSDILRTTVNSTGLTCKNGTDGSLQVCLNVTTFNKTQVCLKVSGKNGTSMYQSSISCASLPTLNVTGASGTNVTGASGTIRRDFTSSLGLLSILGGLTGSSGGGLDLGQIFGLLSIINSIPGLSSLGDLSDPSNLTDLLGGLTSILSIFGGGQ